jgi:hypothetical protein
MQILICPGIHPPMLTEQFLQTFPDLMTSALIYPTSERAAYAGWEILTFIQTQISLQQALQIPLLLIGFSAGVVGAISLAYLWQILGGKIIALIAIDGWGVPLCTSFPVHRLSHDPFTHWSSALLGAGDSRFYAYPSVPHLDLWQAPNQAIGWAQKGSQPYVRSNAAQFIRQIIGDQYSGQFF